MLKPIPARPLCSWQDIMADLVTDAADLLQRLALTPAQVGLSAAAMDQFPLRVPLPYLDRIEPGNPNDPLLLQVLPSVAETLSVPGFSRDPVGESHYNPAPGLLRKYHGRALLLVTSSCAIHCRYCFRRHFPYEDNNPGRRQWQASLDLLRADESIEEVILSGGDPLAAPDRHLAWLVAELERIPHLRRLRIHTRLPIMIPQRVCQDLLQWLGASRLQTVVVIHCNHAREIDQAVVEACLQLRGVGATLLNQSVLLGGINDDAQSLAQLSARLLQAGVLPYYLHMLDKVEGAAHFDISQDRALALLAELRATLPGYLVPRLVREVDGDAAKTPVAPA